VLFGFPVKDKRAKKKTEPKSKFQNNIQIEKKLQGKKLFKPLIKSQQCKI